MELSTTSQKSTKSLPDAIRELYHTICNKNNTEPEIPDNSTPFEFLSRIEADFCQAIDASTEYNKMLQNLEADIRNHIRIEQQLKLHIESIQFKENENLESELKKYKEMLSTKEKECEKLKTELQKKENIERKLRTKINELEPIQNNENKSNVFFPV